MSAEPASDTIADPASTLAATVLAEARTLDTELTEIELLVQQARTEAARHESKRASAAERLAALGQNANPTDVADASRQLVALTRKALVMQGQVDVLEGKAKVLARYRDGASRIADQLDALAQGEPIDAEAPDRETASSATAWGGRGGAAAAAPDADDVHDLPPAVSRMVLSAQEDLRREIARQMHDGPAQSLTNIVLQAQIVDRLLARDPAAAAAEVRQLIVMVQATLDATKSFIFDVRPMVLDDLGLLPTIRRAAREWGRRSRIPVELESFGTDRRLTMELESGLFRIIDDAVGGFLSGRPERITIRMDWTDGLEARVTAHRAAGQSAESGARPSAASAADDAARAEQSRGRGKGKGAAVAGQSEAMPAALAAMIEDRTAEDTAARHAVGALPVAVRREIRQRAATLGVELDLPEDRLEVVVVVPGDGDA